MKLMTAFVTTVLAGPVWGQIQEFERGAVAWIDAVGEFEARAFAVAMDHSISGCREHGEAIRSRAVESQSPHASSTVGSDKSKGVGR